MRTLLQWLIFPAESIFTAVQAFAEVAKLIGLVLQDPLNVLDVYAPLITLTPQIDWKGGTVNRVDLMHHSLITFLTKHAQNGPVGSCAFTPKDALAQIAELCLKYLCTFDSKAKVTRNRRAQSIFRLKAVEIWASTAPRAGIDHQEKLSRCAREWFGSSAFKFTSRQSPAKYMLLAGIIDDLFKSVEEGMDPTDALLTAIQLSWCTGDWGPTCKNIEHWPSRSAQAHGQQWYIDNGDLQDQ